MIEKILERLEKVRRTGKDHWIACCPAHEDSSPSLSLKEKSDGQILMKCFAGCSSIEVLNACNLNFNDLFPDTTTNVRSQRKAFNSSDVLASVSFEVTLISMIADRMYNNRDMTLGDWARLKVASQRLLTAAELIDG